MRRRKNPYEEEITKKCEERFYACTDYLRSHNLRAMSNEVPDEILRLWAVKPDNEYIEYEWGLIDDSECEVEERPIYNYMNSFVYHRIYIWVALARVEADPTYFERTKDADPKGLYHPAELVRYILAARKANRTIPDFDIFDVEHHDELAEKLRRK